MKLNFIRGLIIILFIVSPIYSCFCDSSECVAYVSLNGTSELTCGVSFESPCLTLNDALLACSQSINISHTPEFNIYFSNGTWVYNETIIFNGIYLPTGEWDVVSIYGMEETIFSFSELPEGSPGFIFQPYEDMNIMIDFWFVDIKFTQFSNKNSYMFLLSDSLVILSYQFQLCTFFNNSGNLIMITDFNNSTDGTLSFNMTQCTFSDNSNGNQLIGTLQNYTTIYFSLNGCVFTNNFNYTNLISINGDISFESNNNIYQKNEVFSNLFNIDAGSFSGDIFDTNILSGYSLFQSNSHSLTVLSFTSVTITNHTASKIFNFNSKNFTLQGSTINNNTISSNAIQLDNSNSDFQISETYFGYNTIVLSILNVKSNGSFIRHQLNTLNTSLIEYNSVGGPLVTIDNNIYLSIYLNNITQQTYQLVNCIKSNLTIYNNSFIGGLDETTPILCNSCYIQKSYYFYNKNQFLYSCPNPFTLPPTSSPKHNSVSKKEIIIITLSIIGGILIVCVIVFCITRYKNRHSNSKEYHPLIN